MKQPDFHLGIGDPDSIGWVTFALYLIAAVFSLRMVFVLREGKEKHFWVHWALISLATLLLGLNKELDLQTWLIRTGRHLAESEHIFPYRLVIHISFFLVVVILCAFLAVKWAGECKLFARRFQLGATGCVLIALYVLIRAISINHIDELMHMDWEEISALWLLEVVGLVMVIAETLRVNNSVE